MYNVTYIKILYYIKYLHFPFNFTLEIRIDFLVDSLLYSDYET